MHILDHKRVSWSAFKVAIVTSTSVDITGGRYTRCYDQFKRYFIQAGRSLVFNLPARIYFAKATRGRNVGRRASHPGDAISRGGPSVWTLTLLFSVSRSLFLPSSSHESWWKNNNPGGTVSYGEWNHPALAVLSLRSLSLTNFYFAPVSCNTSQPISCFERTVMEKYIQLSELLNRFVIRLKRFGRVTCVSNFRDYLQFDTASSSNSKIAPMPRWWNI